MTISFSYNYIIIYYSTHKPVAILHHLVTFSPLLDIFMGGDFLSYRIGHLSGVNLDIFMGGDFLSYRIHHLLEVDLNIFMGGDFLSYRICHLLEVDLDIFYGWGLSALQNPSLTWSQP